MDTEQKAAGFAIPAAFCESKRYTKSPRYCGRFYVHIDFLVSGVENPA